jgi:1,3-beta-glucan synthase
MSGYPGGRNDHYDDGYGQQGGGGGHAGNGHQQNNADSYYQDDQYYDNNQGYDNRGQQQQQQGGDGYYDESGYYNADRNNPYHQDGGYYDGHDQYQDDYYGNGQGQGQGQGQGGYYDQDYNQGYDDRERRGRHGSEEESETFSDFTMRSDMARAAEMDYYGRGDERYNSYGESQGGRGYRPASSQISYAGNRSSGASSPNYGMDYGNVLPAGQRSREPYPAWTSDAQIPLSKEEIEDIFMDLTSKFGFQRDSMRNMYDHFMTLLDSRVYPPYHFFSYFYIYISKNLKDFKEK